MALDEMQGNSKDPASELMGSLQSIGQALMAAAEGLGGAGAPKEAVEMLSQAAGLVEQAMGALGAGPQPVQSAENAAPGSVPTE